MSSATAKENGGRVAPAAVTTQAAPPPITTPVASVEYATPAGDAQPTGCALALLHGGDLFDLPPTALELARWCAAHRAPDVKPDGAAYTDALAWLLTPSEDYPGGHPCWGKYGRYDVATTHGCQFDLDGAAGQDIRATLERVELAGHAAVFWHSHSSTPEAPAGRLLVLHKPCPATEHAAVYEALRAELCPLAPASQHNPNRGWNLPRAGVKITVVCDGSPVDWTALQLVAPTPVAEDTDDNTDEGCAAAPSATQRTDHDALIVSELASVWQSETSGHYSWGALGGWLTAAGVSEQRVSWIAEQLADAVSTTHDDPIERALNAIDEGHGMGFTKLKTQLQLNGVGLLDDPPNEQLSAELGLHPMTAAAKIGVVVDHVRGLVLASVTGNDNGPAGPAPAAPAPAAPAATTPSPVLAAAPAAPAPTFFRTKDWTEIMAPLGEVPWLCRGIDLVKGRPAIIGGKSGQGKTWAAQALAMAVATGQPAFGRFDVRQGAVVHLDLDQGEHLTRQRYQQLARGFGVVGELPIQLASSSHKLDEHAAFAALLGLCRGKALCVIDCLRNASSEEENSSAFAAPLQMMARVSELTDCAIVVLHHAGKGDGTDHVDVLRGTSAISGAAGVVLRVTREEDMPARITFPRGSGYGDRPTPFMLELRKQGPLDDPTTAVTLDWVPEGAAGAAGDGNGAGGPRRAAAWHDRVQRCLDAVQGSPGIAKGALRGKIGGDTKVASAVIEALCAGGDNCLGEQIWNYGSADHAKYFGHSAEDLLLTALSAGAKIDATLISDTKLPRQTVKDTLAHLYATNRVARSGSIHGEPAWELLR